MNENLPAPRRSNEVPMPLGGGSPAPYASEWAPQDTFDLQHTFALFYRRRWLLLGIFLSVVGATAIYSWLARPVYQATAQILIDTEKNTPAGQSDLPVLSDLMGLTQGRSVETQAEIIKSPSIQQQAKKLAATAAAKQVSDIAVQVSKNTDIIAVSALSYEPQAAATLANATCAAYIAKTRADNREQTRAAADYVAEQMRSVRERLDQAQTGLKQYKEENVTVDLAAESQRRVDELSQIESALRQTQAERHSAEAELAALSKLSGGGKDQSAAAIIASNPTTEAIKANLVNFEIERTALLQEYTAGSPEVRRVERQIVDAHAQLQQEAARAITHDRAPIQTRVWSLQARAGALSRAAGNLRTELARLPEQEYRLAQLTTDLTVLQQTYQMLNEKYQTLRISEEARQANAKIISAADIPKTPIRPRKAANMALALVLGLALAIGMAAVVDRMDNRVHTDEDAENATGVPVLAYIPLIRNEAERYLARAGGRALPLLEGYRMLRTNLLFAAVDEPARMIAITSTEPGEGKTLSAVNLAVALALDNKKVILVDADLRHPTTHRFFDNPRDIGLSNVIAGEQGIESALQETQVPGLQFLAAGALPPNPPELLNSRAAHACFRQLRDLADFVIVDTPPALVMADAHVVTNLVDGIILVVSAGDVVKQQPLGRTADLLRQNGGRLLGVIMNKLQSGSGSYYGHYYAYSQDRYSKYYQRELPSGEDTES